MARPLSDFAPLQFATTKTIQREPLASLSAEFRDELSKAQVAGDVQRSIDLLTAIGAQVNSVTPAQSTPQATPQRQEIDTGGTGFGPLQVGSIRGTPGVSTGNPTLPAIAEGFGTVVQNLNQPVNIAAPEGAATTPLQDVVTTQSGGIDLTAKPVSQLFSTINEVPSIIQSLNTTGFNLGGSDVADFGSSFSAFPSSGGFSFPSSGGFVPQSTTQLPSPTTFPTSTTSTSGGGSGGGGILSTLGDIALAVGPALVNSFFQNKAAKEAGKGLEAAQGFQQDQFELVQRLLAPFVGAGVESLNAQRALLGFAGPEAEKQFISSVESSPSFQAQLQSGEEAILANASATGNLRGGNTQRALAEFRPQLLANELDRRFAKLGGITSLGQASAAGTAQQTQGPALALSNLAGAQGDLAASRQLGFGQGSTDLFSTIRDIGGF